MARFIRNSIVLVLFVSLAMPTHASDFVPIQIYREPADSPFPEFGFRGSLIVEDFEAGKVSTPGIELSIVGSSSITRGFSVATDSEGLALEVKPSLCAQSFPPSCPATVEVSFDAETLEALPTFVGFVWTDAVASEKALRAPIALITVTDAKGEETVRRINELPFATDLADAQSDDTLVSFLDDDGISNMKITVVTDGTGYGGHLAIDHLQFGLAAASGDADIDGDVDFADFIRLSDSFGKKGVRWGDGDFDQDGETGFPDFLRLSRNFGTSKGPSQVAPEPSSFGLLMLAAMCLLGIRKSR